MSLQERSLFSKNKEASKPITLFASSDYQLSPNNLGEYKIPFRKEGHIEGIIKRFIELSSLGHIAAFLNPGDLTDSGSSGALLDFQFYKNTENFLGFGLSDELSAFKRLIVQPFQKAQLQDLEAVGNHDVPQTNWGRLFGYLAKQTENIFKSTTNQTIHVARPALPRKALTDYIKQRYGGEYYYKTLGDINVVSLGEYPSQKALDWMVKNVPNDKPIVVFWHYNVRGPFSVEGSIGGPWWTKAEREKAFNLLNTKYRTLAVIVGHYHMSTSYKFEGIPVFVVGGSRYLELTIDPNNDFSLSRQFNSGEELDQEPLEERMTTMQP